MSAPTTGGEAFLEALEGTATAVWEWDATHDRLHWSPNLGPLFGLERGHLPVDYRAYLDLVHPDDREVLVAAIDRAVRRGVDFDIEHRAIRPDGSVVWLGASAHVIGDPADGAVRLVGIVRDIGDRRRRADQAQFLALASHILSSSLDYSDTLRRVAELAVPRLADWCAVQLVEGGELVTVVAAHADPARTSLAQRLQAEYPTRLDEGGVVAEVLTTGRSVLLSDIPDELLVAGARDEDHLEMLRQLGLRASMTVPLPVGPDVVGALSLVAAESGRRFDRADLHFAEELARRAGAAIHNSQLFQAAEAARAEAEAAADRLRRLQSVTSSLVGILEPAPVAQAAVTAAVAAVGAHRGSVVRLTGPEARLRFLAAQGYAPADLERLEPTLNDPGPLLDAVRAGAPVFVPTRAELQERYPDLTGVADSGPPAAFAAVPITGSAGVLGALGVVFAHSRAFGELDRELLVAVGAQIGIAIERAELFDRTQRVAETLQRALTPEVGSPAVGMELSVVYQPADEGEVGGDWYDVLELSPRLTALVVGDVVGRGVPAVAAMARLRHTLSGLLHEGYRPAAALDALSRLASPRSGVGFGATVVCAVVDHEAELLRVAWAGHPPAVLRDHTGARLLPWGESPPLGVRPGGTRQVELAIDGSTTLVLYSDGLVERRGEDLGAALERLVRLVAEADAAPGPLTASLARSLADAERPDDVTIVAARFGAPR